METSFEKLGKATDAILIRMFQRGSNRAFYIIVNRHKTNLAKYAHLLLHNTELEKDVMQQVWKEVIEKLQHKKYNETGNFKEWMQGILHKCSSAAMNRESGLVHEAEHAEEITEQQTVDKLFFNKGPRIMRLFYRRYFKEIAKAMHISALTVTSWYSHAVKQLRKHSHKKTERRNARC